MLVAGAASCARAVEAGAAGAGEALLLLNLPSQNDCKQWSLFADLFCLMAPCSDNLHLLIFFAVTQAGTTQTS